MPWQTALARNYRIYGALAPLPGEYDLNFLVTASDGAQYVLKVMRPGCDPALVEMQCVALEHLAVVAPDLPAPRLVRTITDEPFIAEADRLIWLITALPGELYATFRPHTAALRAELGRQSARLDQALAGFSHALLDRPLKWNLLQADWAIDALPAIADAEQRHLAATALGAYAQIRPALLALPRTAIHNDLNDYNLLVTANARGQFAISGLLDFGDLCAAPRVCEVAIAAAYALLDQPDPLRALSEIVTGYHAVWPLSAAEIDLIWPLVRTRLAVSVVNSALMKQQRPDDPYVTISEAPAWRLLAATATIDPDLAAARLRAVCGLPISDAAARVMAWLYEQRGRFAPVLGRDLAGVPVVSLAASETPLPQDPFALTVAEAATVAGPANDEVRIGRYGEPRLIYTAPAFFAGSSPLAERRTIHLGVDLFAPPGTPVCAPLEGVVVMIEQRSAPLDYGGTVVLQHQTPAGDHFYTLYGHLDPICISKLAVGQTLAAGQLFAALGSSANNGGWQPHLHFQLILNYRAMTGQWPGVAAAEEQAWWQAVCPNPAALLNLVDDYIAYHPLDAAGLLRERRSHFAGNLRLSYAEPCTLLRGWRHYLFDEWGRAYLDAYNNVPHVGHAHPRIQAVAAQQLRMLNTNTRYLHPAQIAFAHELLAKFPPSLSVCFFVNSGSEANELALRLARAATGGRDMITIDHGYHGHTTGAIDISAYKFNHPAGSGKPDWVQVVLAPDPYRGPYGNDGERYAAAIDAALERIAARGGRLAGFIAETFPSVAGQIIPPPGYLAAVYRRIRAAGGVCIADEVQTGLGRLGTYYWAFETQGVVPDIVVLGKPLGNGHPIGAVITTAEIARAFDNGIEFFSTFGGSTLSCVIGREVLRIIDEEGFMAHAAQIGDELLAGLRELQQRHAIIGDVRGMGLFIGVELVNDRATRAPATAAAAYLKERLRAERVLIGTEGPFDNVLKIRPPLTFDRAALDVFLDRFAAILGESFIARQG
ncbi:aminotransferase class III-fold pyridoxal phosphate-dependent enzyme [Chloroflexus sp.]|uniref:aminotransferase class III-fold pyridoxal phosphate-dependent enzyme n=1 Tax=Chloroflexus sp. TaxID=1904827 RepID=UPI00298EF62C|nr:aminotransferase class III-fold pyridoxal phosphate-dependent enzyme [Chloroflexus sp.]MDW8403125.1 aminotransferase class III-fold pyridoxal phosphate-dependent enzyme [Chloroflexus sp.]